MAQMILRSTDKLETYIREIEKQERKQKRRKLLVIGGLFLAVSSVAAVAAVSLAGSGGPQAAQPAFRQVAAGNITIYEVDSLLDTERSPIILVQPGGQTDTIRSLKDFLRLTAAYTPEGTPSDFAPVAADAFSFAGEVENIEVQPAAPAESSPARVEIRPYSFAIEGSRIAGEPVMVTIIDFDENLNYVLDLGNGLRQPASQRNTFVYPVAGSYEMRLIASHPSGSSSLYRRKVDILPVPANTPPPSEKDAPAAGARMASSDLKPLDTRRSAPLSVVQSALPTAPLAASAGASENSAILFAAEIMPAFPGGEEQMRKFISNNVNYPARALSANVQGRVIVRFVVQPDGSITDVAVMKGIGYGCDEEAIRVVRSMPKWNPGIHEGKQVAVQRSLSIQFVALN